MLWRVRTTLADRPGALATLARHCGEREVNILGLQIFPGVEGVTDELVLRAPDGWSLADVAELVEVAGGSRVTIGPCTEHALTDGPTRYLHALRKVVRGAATPPAILAGLLDCGTDTATSLTGEADLLVPVQDTLSVELRGELVELHRTTPFTATEHARAVAFAEIAGELLEAVVEPHPLPTPRGSSGGETLVVRTAMLADTGPLIEMHGRCSTETVYRHWAVPMARLDLRLARRLLVGGGGALVAKVENLVVGVASLGDVVDGSCEMSLLVEDAWQRQGIGTRLLGAAARQAADAGADDLVLRGPAESPAAIAMVFGSGLRARVRLAGDELVVTISTRGLGTPGEPAAATVTQLRGGSPSPSSA